MKYKYFFWDWNGTLFNDASSSHAAVNSMLSSRGLPDITLSQYREYIDVPIIRFYEKVMDVSKETMEGLSAEFNDFYNRNLPDMPISEGVFEVLDLIMSKGGKNYIFSSSHKDIIKHSLEKFGLSDYFESVIGAEDCYVGSKVERTCKFIKDNGIPVSEILFIGDMVHDSETASEIGAECILISSGHQCGDALLKTQRKVISSITELPPHIKR